MRVLSKVILALIAITFSATTFADEQATTYELDIEAQALPGALKSFAEQTDLQVVYFASVAEGKDAPAVEGEFTADAALDQLLENADLEYQNVDARTYSIALEAAVKEGGASDSKNSSPAPILMAQNTTTPTQSMVSSSNREDDTSVVAGRVTDARTGANLRGAKVTIVETGQWTSTGDLGRFRFPTIPSGEYTLTVSFLGYASQSVAVHVRGDTVAQEFALRGGSEIEEIVVFGQRSARAIALNQERTAENFSTVVSADQLGNFTGTTLSESLRKVPGVAFQRDEFTGEGSNIIIRGLAPDLNTVVLNGVELPDGTGQGRSAALGNLLTESIEEVIINKTLLPNQDSAGSGGLVEITTKSPLDRDRRYLSVAAEKGRRDGGFNDESLFSVTASGRFGVNENYGLSLSVQHRDRDQDSINYNVDGITYGEYYPLQIDGMPTITEVAPASLTQANPRETFPFTGGGELVFPTNTTSQELNTSGENLAVSIGAAWEIDAHTVLRADFLHSSDDVSRLNRSVRFSAPTTSALLPVAALGGEERITTIWRERSSRTQSIVYVPSFESETNSVSFQGESKLDKYTVRYSTGHAESTTESESISMSLRSRSERDGLVSGLYDEAAITNANGLIYSLFPEGLSGGFPVPGLSPEGFAYFNDPSTAQFRRYNLFNRSGETKRWDADLSVRYESESQNLNYLELGFGYENTVFDNTTGEFVAVAANRDVDGNWPSLETFGLALDDETLERVGIPSGFTNLSEQSIRNFLSNTIGGLDIRDFDPMDPSTTSPDVLTRFVTAPDERLALAETVEDEFVAYLQGSIQLNDFELVGGFRFSQYEIDSVNLRSPTIIDEFSAPDVDFALANTVVNTESATQRAILPRLLLNYRPREDMVFRLGYYRSIARPQINLITNTTSVSLFQAPFFGPNSNQPALIVVRGNPDLKPQETDSFDLSFELYDSSAGVIKAAVFYKRFTNVLESNVFSGSDELSGVPLPDDPRFDAIVQSPDDYFIQVTQPRNNDEAADLWGLELVAEHQFTKLPGLWSGLGIYANYTYTESDKKQPFNFQFSPVVDTSGQPVINPATGQVELENETVVFGGVPLAQQPDHTGTFGLTYNLNGIDANLTYTAQSRRLVSFGAHGLSSYEEAFDTLDGRFEYLMEVGESAAVRLFIEGRDLLRGTDDPSRELTVGDDDGGVGKYYTNGRFLGGRQVWLGIAATF